jgi:hypothetical protein
MSWIDVEQPPIAARPCRAGAVAQSPATERASGAAGAALDLNTAKFGSAVSRVGHVDPGISLVS